MKSELQEKLTEKSRWTNNPVKTGYSSSFYDYGVLDKMDNQLEIAYLEPLISKDMHCLDLGCGNGRFTQYLFKRGCHVDAVDLEAKHIDFIVKNFGSKKVRPILSDAFRFIEETRDQYDFIVISGLLLFLEDSVLKKFFETLFSKLARQAVVVVRDFCSSHDSIRLQSSKLDGAFIYYRPFEYYRQLGFQGLVTARPYHRFPAFERAFFALIGGPAYKFIFASEAMRAATWKGTLARNVMFHFKNP